MKQGNKIKIAFDLDGVIIDKPPLVPKKLLEKLFRGKGHNGLHYRFPHSKLEQRIRKVSHFYLFRPPIKENIKFIRKLSCNPKYELYAVSGRYAFLKNETKNWLEKRKIDTVFKEVYLNLKNEQPHLFKERKLEEIGANIFVDDDGQLADFLAKSLKIKVFCFSKFSNCLMARAVKSIEEIIG